MRSASFTPLVRRMAGVAIALAMTAVALVVAAPPAHASGCATAGHVYLTGGAAAKFETDPINGPFFTVYRTANQSITFGGNGLMEGEDPYWDFYNEATGAYVFTKMGNRTGGNCVSNEKTIPLSGGGTYLIRATYIGGNSGLVVQQQAHIRLVTL